MNNLFKHLKTVHIHRKYVRQMCWRMGLFWQGLVHDLSKYSITELKICKYYTGKGSPHQVCREKMGYSPSWISHYHKNRHHHDFWLDEDEFGKFIPIKMPYKYVIESVCDMTGASKAYAIGKGQTWNPAMTYDYYLNMCEGKRIQHPESATLTKLLLAQMMLMGEEKFIKHYKEHKKGFQIAYENGFFADYVVDSTKIVEIPCNKK